MAFKCLYFVMLKRGAQQHISVCMTVNSESPMSKDHFTAGRECEIMHTDAQYTCRSAVPRQPHSLDHLFTVSEVAIDIQRQRVRSTKRSPST